VNFGWGSRSGMKRVIIACESLASYYKATTVPRQGRPKKAKKLFRFSKEGKERRLQGCHH
jgi:hypothetical protein